MKIQFLLFVLFLSNGLIVRGQTPSIYLKLANKDVAFAQNIPAGSFLIDLATNKQYLTLKTLPNGGATSIASCTLLLLNAANSSSAHLKGINVNGSERHIGDLFGGGIIVAVWRENGVEHGLIASLTDIIDPSSGLYTMNWDDEDVATGVPWGATSFLDGAANCALLTSQAKGAVFACSEYTSDGYSDWYLPAYWELLSIFSAASFIDAVCPSGKLAMGSSYWASSEYSWVMAKAGFPRNYSPGSFAWNNKNNPTYRVRAARRF